MRTRRLGRTGFVINEIGYGAWGLGGGYWRGMEPRDAQRALYHAVERGIDFLDTALVYGDGTSEQLLGEVVRELRARDRVVVATKVPPASFEWPGDGKKPLEASFPARHVQDSVETSLRNLKLEAISLCQLHVWHDAWLQHSSWPELRGTLERLVKEGKVLHWGISANDHDPDVAVAVLDEPIMETVQVIYNLFDRGAERALFAKARERDAGIIGRVPLDEGSLGGELGADTRFPPDDWRNEYFGGDRLSQLAVRLARLSAFVGTTPRGARTSDDAKAIVEQVEKSRDEVEAGTLAELALRFVLSRDEVGVVIPGMRTVDHVERNLAISDGRRLSPALLDKLAEHVWERNWY